MARSHDSPPPPHTHTHTGIAEANSLMETIVQHPHLFGNQTLSLPQQGSGLSRNKSLSSECLAAYRVSSTTGKGVCVCVCVCVHACVHARVYACVRVCMCVNFSLIPQTLSHSQCGGLSQMPTESITSWSLPKALIGSTSYLRLPSHTSSTHATGRPRS